MSTTVQQRVDRIEDQINGRIQILATQMEKNITDLHLRIDDSEENITRKLDEHASRVLERFDTITEKLDQKLGHLDGKITQLDRRITILEHWRWIVVGGTISIFGLILNFDKIRSFFNPR